jgi:hypothetical protein
MSEWSRPLLPRMLLRTLSALLTICLLVQFFIAGDRRHDRSWMVDISQRLGRDTSMAGRSASDPGVAWRSCSWTAHTDCMHPPLQIALQYVLAHRAIEGRLAIGLGLHALDAGRLLLIAAGLAAGLFD